MARRTLGTVSALVAASAVVFAACSPGASSSPSAAASPSTGGGGASPSAAAEPAELRVTTWTANPDHLALLNGLGDEYKAAHPEVTKIQFDSIPYDDYVTTIGTQLAGGNPPDLGWLVEANAKDFIAAGALQDVGPLLSSSTDYDLADFAPGPIALWKNGEQVSGIPFSTSPFGVYYNADLFEQAGLETPDQLAAKGEWTWDALRTASKAIKDKTGKFGYVIPDISDYKLWDYLAVLWRGFGANAWSEDGKTCTMDAPEMVAAMTFLRDMIFTDKSFPGPGVTADFFAGETGMGTAQLSSSARLKDAPFKWGVVGLPKGPAGDNQVFGQAAFVAFEASKHKEAAANFLEFLTSKAGVEKLAQFFPPARESLLTTDVLAKANKILTPDQLKALVIDGMAKGTIIPVHTTFNQIHDAVEQAIQPLWQPEADVQGTLTAVCDAIEPLLAQ